MEHEGRSMGAKRGHMANVSGRTGRGRGVNFVTLAGSSLTRHVALPDHGVGLDGQSCSCLIVGWLVGLSSPTLGVGRPSVMFLFDCWPISGAPSTAAMRDSVGHLLHHRSTLVCGGVRTEEWCEVSAERVSFSSSRMRLYIPVSAVIPPVVVSHTLIRHELLFRSCYHRQGVVKRQLFLGLTKSLFSWVKITAKVQFSPKFG
ncbi:hypothetical protein F2Q69_00053180 [Brassica cretica]|uniref:Uncharacterized protein n=1 Tax=Brassica cretica TaxID=69181 RepID=A0A8S9MZD0_BRACR|nr:hypothetical protein F2Q69_00053180 [Brassica cretica]